MFKAPDNKTGNLLPGMPVRFTQNIALEIRVSNRTEGTLVGADFSLGTVFHDASIFGVRCKVSNKLSLVAYVRAQLVESELELCIATTTYTAECSTCCSLPIPEWFSCDEGQEQVFVWKHYVDDSASIYSGIRVHNLQNPRGDCGRTNVVSTY